MADMDKEFGSMTSTMSSMSSSTTVKSSSTTMGSSSLDSSNLGSSSLGSSNLGSSSLMGGSDLGSSSLMGGSLGAERSLMEAGIGGGRLVPTKLFDWNFFDRQKSMFSQISKNFGDDFATFDRELELMRKDMFRFDGNPMLKVDQPFVETFSGNKKLSLTFDVSEYKPEDIHIKTVDSMLTVHAKHEEKSPGKSVYREFTKSYTLPSNIDPLALTSALSADGVLSIEAPAPKEVQAKKERFVPIELLKPL